MPLLTPEKLESFMRQYGWRFYADAPGHWLTGWQGESRLYPMSIKLSDSWLLMQVKPFVELPDEVPASAELASYLLQLNHDAHMVKLGMDEDQTIVLSMQMFSANLSYEIFSDAIGVLGYYAELLYDDLHVRASTSGRVVQNSARFLT